MYGYLNPDLATADSAPAAPAAPAAGQRSRVPHRRTMRVARGVVMGTLALLLSLLIVAADHALERWWQVGTTFSVLVLWSFVFACLALLAGKTGRVALRLALATSHWRGRRKLELTDQQRMAMAQRDPRVKADVEAALQAQQEGSGSEKYFAPGYCRYL